MSSVVVHTQETSISRCPLMKFFHYNTKQVIAHFSSPNNLDRVLTITFGIGHTCIKWV